MASTRGVVRPCTSPTRNTTWPSTLFGTPRRTVPGPVNSTEMRLAMQPTVRLQPTTPATVSSFMQFCRETTKPPGP